MLPPSDEITAQARNFVSVFAKEIDKALEGATEEWFAEHTTLTSADWAEYKPRLMFEVYDQLRKHTHNRQWQAWREGQ